MVDCDVLQADGSTRTAAVTGAYIALQQAMNAWIARGDIHTPFILEPIAAISVGCLQEKVFLDLDYQEDSTLDADYNVVLTASGKIIEIQGTAEKYPVAWEHFNQMMECARRGIATLFTITNPYTTASSFSKVAAALEEKKVEKNSLFSLKTRLNASLTNEKV